MDFIIETERKNKQCYIERNKRSKEIYLDGIAKQKAIINTKRMKKAHRESERKRRKNIKWFEENIS